MNISNSLFSEEELNVASPSKESEDGQLSNNLGILHYALCRNLNFTGKYEMPVINPVNCSIPKRIIAYYRTTTGNYQNCVPHFYTDDKHIEGIWRNPCKIQSILLSRQTIVIGPDFSVFAEMLFPQKAWNIFRNKLIVAWWQQSGITVIPNVSWINCNYECSFDGWPKHSVIAVNSTGVGFNKRSKAMWIDGYRTMLEVLKPNHILRYGAKQPGENESISTYYPNDNLIIARYGR